MRKLLSLLAVAVSLTLLGLVSAGPAAALGGESLGCAVNWNGTQPFTSYCTNSSPGNSNVVSFAVLNESGSYSFAWSVPSPWSSHIVGGCTSTSDYCQFSAGNTYHDDIVSVTLTQNGASETLSAEADIEPWCGNYLC